MTSSSWLAAARSAHSCDRWLLLLVILSCLFYSTLTPPFQAPDEPQHFNRAVLLAHGRPLAERRGSAIGGDIDRRFADLSQLDFPREAFGAKTRYRVADVIGATAARPTDSLNVFCEFPNVASYPPTLYIPQAIGILIGNTLGVSALASSYLARLVNVLAFIALLGAAAWIMPFGRSILLAIAALPTAAYQAASVSPDATINGFGWLVLALSLSAGYRIGHAGRLPAWLVAAAVPLGLCKGLYAPIALAGARGRAAWWCLIAFLAGATAFILWTVVAGGDQPTYVVESRVTGRLVHTVPMREQLSVIVAAPLRFARILVASMAERSPVYGLQLVGRFGWNAILLPLLAYPLAVAMLVAAVLTGLGRDVPAVVRLWWLLLGVGMMVMVETALYLTGTPRAAGYIQGTQGRYFLPLLPLLLLAIAPAAGFGRLGVRPERWLLGTAIALHIVTAATLADAFWIHGFRAQRGLPAIAHDMAGVGRALVLPSQRW